MVEGEWGGGEREGEKREREEGEYGAEAIDRRSRVMRSLEYGEMGMGLYDRSR